MEKTPIIAIDVSKGSSHVCGFEDKKNKFESVFVIEHDKIGFNKLTRLKQALTSKFNCEPIVIYESTGIYHRPLKTFLEDSNFKHVEVSPLLAAKHRKNSSIRSAKTDARDTQALANLYYDLNPKLSLTINELYHNLSQFHRYYDSMSIILIKLKVHYNEKLDVLYPGFRKQINDKIYKNYYLELIKQYPHPNLLKTKRVDSIENLFIQNGMRASNARYEAKRVKAYAKNCFPGSSEYSVDCFILKDLVQEIQNYIKKTDFIIEQMTNLVKGLPLYTQLLSIPGVGYKTVVKLLAELGDLSRFSNTKQLVAYAGLDPIISQSGQRDSKGLSISKKGNKFLRKALYQVVKVSVSVQSNNSIKSFYLRKKQTSSHKSALIASCDKLLRIIFKMNKTGELFIN